ncbi:MAG: tetratricopeptide repeat protein [Planctomycetaceae bacterium]
MDEIHRQHVHRLYLALAELPEGERARALARACGKDAALRAEVEALLASAGSAGDLPSDTSAPAADAAPEAPSPVGEESGAQIDRYKLLERIGEGGMGTIWMAEQREPVRRRVALKIIKMGMDTKQVIARFEAERQALAMMDHPHIAKVFDAGATETGRPYFVMEYIKGIPILAYCDQERLETRSRLALFTSVCHAIQHAHQKGIIHRDIKPSNILVTLHDGVPVPKVIDFGIAKATSSELTAKTLFTEHRQMIGTPAYMSPEQAEMSGLDIDTRSDIYSLGVLLYELLTGTTPFDIKALLESGFGEMMRAIREDEPHRPSTRVSTLGETGARTAQQRKVDLKKLGTLLRGDIDWIVMKCLEKDRTRRYDSAEALASDIRRSLAGEAVLAAPPSAGYRMRKFVRRHRGAVAAAATVAATLVTGVVAFAWQARAAQDERDVAMSARESEAEQRRLADAQRDRALKAEEVTKARAAELALVADFQGGMLEQVDPAEAGRQLSADVAARFAAALEKAGADDAERAERLGEFRNLWSRVSATDAAAGLIDRTILKPAIAAIDAKFAGQPLVDAQLRQALAERYAALGLYAEAAPLQARALEVRQKLLGDDDPRTLQSLHGAAHLLSLQGRVAEAEAKARDVLARRRRVLGEDHKETVDSTDALARVLLDQHLVGESTALLREVVAWRERHAGERHRETIAAMTRLALALRIERRHDDAQALLRDALSRATAAYGADSKETTDVLADLAVHEQERGRLSEAERYFRSVLESHRRYYGEDHHHTLIILGNLGFVLREQGKIDAAETILRDSFERRGRTLGHEHPSTLWSLHDLGLVYLKQERFAEAETCLRRAWEGRRAIYGESSQVSLWSLDSYTHALRTMGRDAEAEKVVRSVLDRIRERDGEDGPITMRAVCLLASALIKSNPAAAEPLFRRVFEAGMRKGGPDSFDCLDATTGIAVSMAGRGKPLEAAQFLHEALERRKETPTSALLPLVPGLAEVARILDDAREWTAAEALYREEVRICRGAHGDEHAATLDAVNRLGATLQHQTGRAADAEPFLRESYERRLRTLGPDHPSTLNSVRNMWIVLMELSRFGEAEPFCRRDLEVLARQRGPIELASLEEIGEVACGYCEILAAQGRAADAAPHLRESLARVRKEATADDPHATRAIHNLARAFRVASLWEEAEELSRDAVARAERAPDGPDSPLAHDCRMWLAALFWAQGKLDRSVPLFEAEVARMRAAVGPTHRMTYESELTLAINLRDAARTDEAIALFAAAIRGARGAGGDAAALIRDYVLEYLRALDAAGRHDEAVRALCDYAEDVRRQVHGGGLAYAAELMKPTTELLQRGAWTEAEPLLREVIATREAAAPDLWSLFNARALLGEALFRRGRFAEAEPLVVGGYEGVMARRAQVPPQGEQWIEKAAARILHLYEAWHAAEPGKGHDIKLAEWKSKLKSH